MKLSEIVRNYRLENDLSQREFAKRCNLSNSYISFIENECNPKTGRPMVPTIEQYKKMADGMNITVQRLFEMLDVDSPVKLNHFDPRNLNLKLFEGGPAEEARGPDQPKNEKVRLLMNGANKLSDEQIEQLTDMMRVMFEKSVPDLFEKGPESDDHT